METLIGILLLLIIIELACILYILNNWPEKANEKINKRREIYGDFKNPLGDNYRKNPKGQYVPIKPYGGDQDGV